MTTLTNFNYYVPTEVLFGCGRLVEVGAVAAGFGARALLVTDASAPIKPLAQKVLASLKEAGVTGVQFDGVVPNPTTDVVTAGANVAKRERVQVVIGLGGGSSIDTAKAIAVEATHEGCAWDYLYYKNKPTDKTLPIIAIGTTAGTGSQATMVAVLTNSAQKDKSAICHRNVFPKVAIVDPEVTASMPASVTAQTGFDAFCHNFESYLSVKTSPVTDALALDALARIIQYLPSAIEDGKNMEARREMAWADTLGGFTNACSGTTLPHGLGMQIGGHCPQITHGQALAAVYPSFTRYTRPAAVGKFAAVARLFDGSLCGVDDEAASHKCCEHIDAFLKQIGLWVGLKQFGATKQDIREIADCGQVLGDYKRNPREATVEEMYTMLMESYERQGE